MNENNENDSSLMHWTVSYLHGMAKGDLSLEENKEDNTGRIKLNYPGLPDNAHFFIFVVSVNEDGFCNVRQFFLLYEERSFDVGLELDSVYHVVSAALCHPRDPNYCLLLKDDKIDSQEKLPGHSLKVTRSSKSVKVHTNFLGTNDDSQFRVYCIEYSGQSYSIKFKEEMGKKAECEFAVGSGHFFTIVAIWLNDNGKGFKQIVSRTNRAVFSKAEIENRYLRLAAEFEDFPREQINHLYREMDLSNPLRFEPAMRGRIGHPANPLSLDPKVLTHRFCCTLWDEKLPTASPTGSRQYSNRIDKILGNPMEINMWFVDYYCIRKLHYVTLVLTKRGSKMDKYCHSQKYYNAPLHECPFFCVQTFPDGGGFQYWTMFKQSELYPEILLTEDFPVDWDKFKQKDVSKLDYGVGAEHWGFFKGCSNCK